MYNEEKKLTEEVIKEIVNECSQHCESCSDNDCMYRKEDEK
jgi:hypothetical protein